MKFVRLAIVFFLATLYLQAPGSAKEVLPPDLQTVMIEIKQMRESYESRIAALETQIQELKEQRGQDIAAPDQKPGDRGISVDYVGRQQGPFQKGGLVAETSDGFATVSVGGYADIELENFQNRHSTFDQHRWVFALGAEIGERLKFFSELEVEHGGEELEIEQAWFDYVISEALTLRAGAILIPFGRYNLYHDSDQQDLTDRPILARDIIPTTWTEAGAGIHGTFNPALGNYEDLEVGYEFYFINGFDDGFSDTGLRGARGSLREDNNNQKSLVGRLTLSPSIGHEVGLSGYWGAFNGEEDSIKGIGLDFLTTWGPLEVLGEWAYFGTQESPRINGMGTGDITNHLQGMYIQTNYHFWFDVLNDTFLGKSFSNPTFTAVGRFDWAEIDDDGDAVGGSNNEEWRFTLGLNYRPVESWVLKLEYQNNFTRYEPLERGDNEGFIASIAMGF